MNTYKYTKIGDELIWKSSEEKLLGVTIDKNLNFNAHLSNLCKKVGAKVTALSRVVKLLPFYKKRILLKTFIESQFSFCPLIWMFCSRNMNNKINRIHERALRLVYEDYTSTFHNLLKKDRSVSIHHRNIHQVAIEMYKVKHDLSPQFIKDIFSEKQRYSKRLGTVFARTKVTTVYKGENSLRIFGPIVWNEMLPEKFKKCSNLNEFKNAIKEWIPINCPCRICKNYVAGVGFVTT